MISFVSVSVKLSLSVFGFFSSQKYNADYDLSAKEGADSLAFISLMEEKLIPALVRYVSLSAN